MIRLCVVQPWTIWENTAKEKFVGLGMLEVGATHRRPILKLVKHRSRRHLLHILRKNVRSGSQILSECWRAYSTVQQHYIHYQVNHRRYFIHPQSGAHTQHMVHIQRKHTQVQGKPHQTFPEKTSLSH